MVGPGYSSLEQDISEIANTINNIMKLLTYITMSHPWVLWNILFYIQRKADLFCQIITQGR
jgi:hypothetical protein